MRRSPCSHERDKGRGIGVRHSLRSSGVKVSLARRQFWCGLAAAKLLIQFAGINHYGFFRDELYYMACGEHLAWGYVDQPPLIALVAWLARHLFGPSMVSMRLFPVLAGAAVVWLTGILARDLGGGRLAQFLRPRQFFSRPPTWPSIAFSP